MRLSLRGANLAEWLALRAGLAPTAAAEAWAGMALSGVIIAAVQSGVTARLSEKAARAVGSAIRGGHSRLLDLVVRTAGGGPRRTAIRAPRRTG